MATQLDVIDAQFVGFFYGRQYTEDIVGLVESMGVTKKEWLKLKSEYPTFKNVNEYDIKKIDAYFGIS